ncbi:MAG: bifunctional hydroxymethylpyrimidine kinase/phosphomethylpyrimidine kinase [Rickettsiales bacterium]|nr:bifunctional hydroxymethylpyrimidine kinase/phosphomethylpyrimidine kinase [Rickettsiales bacterium]
MRGDTNKEKMNKISKILIIAGSDSGAGAGIQADIKTAFANGVYASTAITSVTAQNTLGVQSVEHLSDGIISAQITSVLSDISADYIKTGMLANERIIKIVSKTLENYNIPIVADPVMVAKGGYKLLEENAIDALKKYILSKAFLITPNIPEAEFLCGFTISNINDMKNASQSILEKIGCNAVLLKGGHLEGDILTDILAEKGKGITLEISDSKIQTINTHGTGCSYASAITSNLAKGQSIVDAIKKAHKYVRDGIISAPKIGSGHNPINHGFR